MHYIYLNYLLQHYELDIMTPSYTCGNWGVGMASNLSVVAEQISERLRL